MLATLLCAQGTPMLLAGDEYGQTQRGNNNAYCQDNEIAWLDWQRFEQEPSRTLFHFVHRLIRVRAKHSVLRSRRWLDGNLEIAPNLKEITWFDEHGQLMTEESWREPEARTLVLRRAARHGRDIEVTLLLLNAGDADVQFTLPPPQQAWTQLLDSADAASGEQAVQGDQLGVAAKAAKLLVARFTAEEPAAS
jgi:glycogen operon protein